MMDSTLTGNDRAAMGGSPSPILGRGEPTCIAGGTELFSGGSMEPGAKGGAGMKGMGIGDMGAIRAPLGLGKDMPLFMEEDNGSDCGFSGGSEPMVFFMTPPVSSSESVDRTFLKNISAS